jgi:6-phosphogluconolactonase (cycloisomerase 2 family)
LDSLAVTNYESGKMPRGFNFDPMGKFVVAQLSRRVEVHAIDQKTGELI